MMRWLLVLIVLLSGPAFAQQVPVMSFESIPNVLKLPANLYLGEATGVAVNSKKHIFVLSRGNVSGPAFGAAAAQLLEFNPDGRFIREIGKNLYAWAFGHTVRIDKEDNIWVTDKGSDMIVKFNPEGRVLMVFGRKQEASEEALPYKRTGPAAQTRRWALQTTDRRDLGSRRQCLYQRRLCQFPNRQGRQEW